MGFNIQQYEIGSNIDDSEWSNASGRFCELIINKNKRAECEKARNERKGGGDENVTADTALSKGAVCVKGTPIYINPPIYALTSRSQRTKNRIICKARKEAKMKDDVVPVDAIKDNPATDSQAPSSTAPSSGTPDSEKSKTMMYVGIGAGILALGIVAIVLIKRNK